MTQGQIDCDIRQLGRSDHTCRWRDHSPARAHGTAIAAAIAAGHPEDHQLLLAIVLPRRSQVPGERPVQMGSETRPASVSNTPGTDPNLTPCRLSA